ncbi:hypothetical protein Emed_001318 [Eimeria media]
MGFLDLTTSNRKRQQLTHQKQESSSSPLCASLDAPAEKFVRRAAAARFYALDLSTWLNLAPQNPYHLLCSNSFHKGFLQIYNHGTRTNFSRRNTAGLQAALSKRDPSAKDCEGYPY